MPMIRKEYNIRFSTPAFLGNAEQQGQWRTPPFKALLRQWWRIAYVQQYGVKVDQMRAAEAKLFGAAADTDATRAKLQLRLTHWDNGAAFTDPQLKVTHPEVKAASISAALYLGYGPISTKGNKNAIPEGKTNRLSLFGSLDEQESQLIQTSMELIRLFGTIGGRSRNGWGSLIFDEQPFNSINDALQLLKKAPAKPLVDCLKHDWPSALGRDNKGLLIWHASERGDWKQAMQLLAQIKIDYRTKLKFTEGKLSSKVEARHILSYPVTNHSVKAWGNNLRLPNSLRFKVLKIGDNQYLPIAFHIPHQLPDAFKTAPDPKRQLDIWTGVHQHLDSLMTRI